MNRRVIALRKVFHAALVGAVVFLSLLPSLGWAWHRVLPEHDHWFIGGTPANLHRELATQRFGATDECLDCDPLPPSAAILHFFNPTSAIQIVAIAAALCVPFFVFIPPEVSRLQALQPLAITSPDLPVFDPPPKSA